MPKLSECPRSETIRLTRSCVAMGSLLIVACSTDEGSSGQESAACAMPPCAVAMSSAPGTSSGADTATTSDITDTESTGSGAPGSATANPTTANTSPSQTSAEPTPTVPEMDSTAPATDSTDPMMPDGTDDGTPAEQDPTDDVMGTDPMDDDSMTSDDSAPVDEPDVDAPVLSGPEDPDPNTDSDNETLVHLSVKFYGAQRSGEGPNWLLDGQACHTGDGEPIGADLSGGWHDAGDHLKPTLTNAFASYLMLKAFEAYPTAFADKDDPAYGGAPNGIPDVLDEVRYATDYLVKAHVSPTELVGMVGDTNADHSNWVTCVFQETLDPSEGGHPRPVSMDANADIAGLTSGALALMARLVRPYDATLAETYLSHALEVYEIADANRMGSNPGLYGQTGGFGGGAQWTDEMLCGAVELYRETGEQRYLDDALDLNEQTGSHQWAPNWGQVADFCRHSLYLAGETEAALEHWAADVANYAANVSSAQHVSGMIYFDEWGSLRYAANAAFSAALHHAVTGDAASATLAQSQLDYIVGDNEHARSFVVGFGPNPPTQPHHRNAHGHDEDDMSLPFMHSLAGALVGGPTATAAGNTEAGYIDDVADYVGNEVALDYNAGLVGLAAFGVNSERQ